MKQFGQSAASLPTVLGARMSSPIETEGPTTTSTAHWPGPPRWRGSMTSACTSYATPSVAMLLCGDRPVGIKRSGFLRPEPHDAQGDLPQASITRQMCRRSPLDVSGMCLLRFPIQQLPPERTTFRAAWNTPQIAADCPPRGRLLFPSGNTKSPGSRKGPPAL